jgi:hypothetical protein
MPAVTVEHYADNLAALLDLQRTPFGYGLYGGMTIEELEQAVDAAGLTTPIVRLPEHFHYRNELFPHVSKNPVKKCRCTAQWPCPLGEENDRSTAAGIDTTSGAKTGPLPHYE